MKITAIEEVFLYNSEIMEKIKPNVEYLRLQNEGYAQYEKLKKTLNEEQIAQLEKLLDTEMDKEAEAVDEHFIKGLKYGMRLAVECLT